jgi:hypothetical protein
MKHVSPPSDSGIEALTARRISISDDVREFNARAREYGWSDGLPLYPPTEATVRELIATTPYRPSDVIGTMPPKNRDATVEYAAINAAMAGVEPEGFPWLIAALEAICDEPFSLYGVSTTTGSVIPMIIANGPGRDGAGIDYRDGCMGGAGGIGSATIGRALTLCMRNIGGQRVGDTSRSVFGQPARAAGLCFAEWEEQSPWPSLAEQRGFLRTDDVVTVHGGMGTHAMADINCDDARELLALLAQSIAFPLGNKFLAPTAGKGETVVAVNPEWAKRFGVVFPDIDDAKAWIHEHAWQPIELWPQSGREILERKGRVDAKGRVWLNDRPDQIVLIVCGGLGNLHAVSLPSWADSEIASRAVVRGG